MLDEDLIAAANVWRAAHPSGLLMHSAMCCRVAAGWIVANDRSLAEAAGTIVPWWLRHWKHWGPSPWPLHWCEAVRLGTWDCGVFAAAGDHLMRARGLDSRRVLAIEEATPTETQQWRHLWEAAGREPTWTHGAAAYHEVCGLVSDGVLSIWDPTEAVWIRPGESLPQAPVLALKVFAANDQELMVNWQGVNLPCGVWVRTGATGGVMGPLGS